MTLAAVMMAATACTTSEIMPEEKAKASAGEDSPVTVTFDLNLADEIDATPGTKAINDPAAPGSPEIRNLCVLQYRGTTEAATLVGVHYFSKDITDPEDEQYLADDYSSIKLSDSWGATHTLIILANTFAEIDPPGQGDFEDRTLGDMLHAFRSAEGEASVFGHTGSGTGFPTDVDYYQRLNAIVVTKVVNGKTVHAVMRRSMSRINVQIVNTSSTDNLKIISAQLKNVSQKDYYLTDYSYIDTWDSWSDYTTANLISAPFHDEYAGAVPMRVDYRAREWTEGGASASLGGTGTANFTWYAPCNMRGTFSSTGFTPTPEMKGTLPNAQGATYLEIVAVYGEVAADPAHEPPIPYTPPKPVVYHFYLGKNLTDNFDLDPGKSYSYKFTFNGKGRPSTDGRVTTWGGEDFTVDANCYMLCPPPAGTAVYSFNVVHRINTFWGSPNGDRYGYYANNAGEYPNNHIHSGETWKARILWSDYPYDRDAILTNKTGTGAGSYTDATQRVQITIPAGTEPGNLVIGVWTDDPDNILWSWHIWITDYKPDEAKNLHPIENTYVYKVTGGEVHRYGGTMWTTGRYKDAFIMDRNLGALRDWWSPSREHARGDGFYYQFGRKDPLPRQSGITSYTYAYDDEPQVKYGTQTYTVNSAHWASVPNSNFKIGRTATGQDGKNVPWSIKNPTVSIEGSPWTSGDVFNPSPYVPSIEWNDSKNSSRDDYEEGDAGNAQNKSFFDPCPPGWRVPVSGWADHFSASNFVFAVESTYGRNRGDGRTYFPEDGGFEGNKDNPNRQTIFFPRSRDRYTYDYYKSTKGAYGSYWSSTRNSLNRCYDLCFNHNANSGGIGTNAGNEDFDGYNVRCIKE